MNVDEHEIAGLGLVDIHEEAGVGLLVDQAVIMRVAAEAMVEDPARTVIAVETRVEEAVGTRRPGGAAAGVLDRVVEVLAAL